jgi:TPR repeat protein
VRTPATELPAHLIQQALEDVGFYSGRVDGLVGPGTRQAIRAYQAAQGEAQTGELSGEQTVALIRQAAASGHPKSENTLGMMAAEGVGVPQDARDAFRWFKSAADKGDAYGAYNLAILYRDGRGVASSVADARKYFALAVSGGHPQAAQALRELDD